MQKLEISSGIDWISCTYPFGYESEGKSVVYRDDSETRISAKATNGYTQAWRVKSGALIQQNPERKDMGIHVVYTAKNIAKSCEYAHGSQKDLLDFLMSGARITRLDLCLDVMDSGITIESLYAETCAGKVKTRAKTVGYIESKKIGNEKGAATLYIGSMKKRKKLLRVYDKGEQLGLNEDWKRFELETHGEIANNAALALVDLPDKRYGDRIRGMIKAYADFSQTKASEIFQVNNVPLAVPKYKKSGTAAWLVNVVAPTLAREAFLDYDVLGEFLDRFQKEYEALQEESS